jgi:hypothetical protein
VAYLNSTKAPNFKEHGVEINIALQLVDYQYILLKEIYLSTAFLKNSAISDKYRAIFSPKRGK